MIVCDYCKKEIDTEKEIFGVCPHCEKVTCEECMKKKEREKN